MSIQVVFLSFLPNDDTVSHPVNACMEKRESGTNLGLHRRLLLLHV